MVKPKRGSFVGLLPTTMEVFGRTQGGESEAREHDSEQVKLAGFLVGDGLYGIDIMRIKEVIQAKPYPIRKVPHAPAFVEGVIQLRGVVIPVIDVRTRFGITPDPSNERFNKLIIVSVQGRIVGLKVCRIYGELRVPFSALRPAPSVLRAPSGASEFFAGVCRTDDELAFVINLEALLDPSNASLLAPINQAAHEDAAEQS